MPVKSAIKWANGWRAPPSGARPAKGPPTGSHSDIRAARPHSQVFPHPPPCPGGHSAVCWNGASRSSDLGRQRDMVGGRQKGETTWGLVSAFRPLSEVYRPILTLTGFAEMPSAFNNTSISPRPARFLGTKTLT